MPFIITESKWQMLLHWLTRIARFKKPEWHMIQLSTTDHMVQIIVNFVSPVGDNIKMRMLFLVFIRSKVTWIISLQQFSLKTLSWSDADACLLFWVFCWWSDLNFVMYYEVCDSCSLIFGIAVEAGIEVLV